MISLSEMFLEELAVHKVGNKAQGENILFSEEPIEIDEDVSQILLHYFTSPFKDDEYFHFHHESDIGLNEVYQFASRIFDNPSVLFEQSINLAKHLFEASIHPNIQPGEFYVCLFSNCYFGSEVTNAIGLFKSENKEPFLKVYPKNKGFAIEAEKGININKLDKGCIIVNTERASGYVVCTVDQLNKGKQATFWIDDFLKVVPKENEYFFTENLMQMCKGFVKNKLPEIFDIDMVDQADILNKSAHYLKENDQFEFGDFSQQVMQQPELMESFQSYKQEYEQDYDLEIANEFEISDKAVKKRSGWMRSVIKLDKNFHIYVHGDRNKIVKGQDPESGLNFYQIFFKEEH
jgi:hypothetical protein